MRLSDIVFGSSCFPPMKEYLSSPSLTAGARARLGGNTGGDRGQPPHYRKRETVEPWSSDLIASSQVFRRAWRPLLHLPSHLCKPRHC
ncbi:hypothetical protein E2C01_011557 [Portunus trituberculatus]|uniref:Uncharacterized protein n=1 Tax=Portunus trituberculatus TaxID=210409 RepID=A0A5B7DCA2_PORTR|nr:hypothetical protein [Portunus trituberculatus]